MPLLNADQLNAVVGRIGVNDGELGDLVRTLITSYGQVTADNAAGQAILDANAATLGAIADSQDALETTIKDIVNPATPAPPVPDLPPVPVASKK